MNDLQPGTVIELKVSHRAPFGFFLTAESGGNDILLHENDCLAPLEDGERVTVFLYQDHEGRLAAAQRIPTIQLGRYGWATATTQHKKYGVFLNIGIQKDILLSKDDLPEPWQDWPAARDRVFCCLKIDKKGRLFAQLADETAIHVLRKDASDEAMNSETDAVVYRFVNDGFHVLSAEGWTGFLHKNETTGRIRLGETIRCRITDCKPDGSVNLSMKPRVFERIDSDAAFVFSYLQQRGGAMPYGDKTPAEEVAARFKMSKGSFKKALGRLLREKQIEQRDGWTYLK
ncbi:MAG: S1-like domain-containing RNA-binding protein [Sporolactobacillus sp.]